MVLRVKSKIYKIIGIVFVLASLAFGGYMLQDTIMVYKNNLQQDALLEELKERKAYESVDFELPDEHQKGQLIKPELETFRKKTEVDNTQGETVGVLSIPGIDINLPVVEGVGGENLFRGAATNKIGQVMGEGNYVLASHYMYDGVSLFAPLDKLEQGMKIYVSDYNQVHVYTYEEIVIVEPTEGNIMSDRGLRELTLYTCTEVGDFREVYHANYDGYYIYDELSQEQLTEMGLGE